MGTRLEQIQKQIRLWKVLNVSQINWYTSLDDNTINKLQNLGYLVEEEHFGRYYVISW